VHEQIPLRRNNQAANYRISATKKAKEGEAQKNSMISMLDPASAQTRAPKAEAGKTHEARTKSRFTRKTVTSFAGPVEGTKTNNARVETSNHP